MGDQEERRKKIVGKRVSYERSGKENERYQPTNKYVLSTQETYEQGVYCPNGNVETNKNVNRQLL